MVKNRKELSDLPAVVLPSIDGVTVLGIDNPEEYLEGRSTKYVRALEELCEAALKAGFISEAHSILVSLLRMTPVGRSKADLSLKNQLRDQPNLEEVDTKELLRVLQRDDTERLDDNSDGGMGNGDTVPADSSITATYGVVESVAPPNPTPKPSARQRRKDTQAGLSGG